MAPPPPPPPPPPPAGADVSAAAAAAAPFVDRRSYIADVPAEVFRAGRPTYDAVNATYAAHRSRRHDRDSLPDVLEWLVKTWEAEVSHKPRAADVQSVAPGWTITTNGGPAVTLEAFLERGSYNSLMGPEDGYDPAAHSFASSHDAFRGAFPDGFAWEVLDVWSPPPTVAFSWHHFGAMKGAYGGAPPSGRMLHLYGSGVAHTVGGGADGAALRIASVEIFYDPTVLLHQLAGKRGGAFDLSTPLVAAEGGGGGCPLGFGGT